MVARLSQFDLLLTRRRASRSAPSAADRALAPVPTVRVLRDPWGEPVAEFTRAPSDLDLLRAAFRIGADDWLGVLADDRAGRGLNAAWRLSLIRADRHGRARVSREIGPQALGDALHARPGQRPAELRQTLHADAVRQLWRAGWKLVG